MAYLPVTERSYLTEIKLSNAPAVNQRISFQDVPELSQRKFGSLVYGIQCFKVTDLATSPNGNTVVSRLDGMVVTFAEEATETIFQYPCNDLNPVANSGLIRMFNKKKINLPKSYITIFNITGLNLNDAVLFNFIYGVPNS